MPRAVCCICFFLLLVSLVSADEDLYYTTLPLDIETSDYYELEAWCERLGLDAGGTRKDLENRLRAHYGLGQLGSFARGKRRRFGHFYRIGVQTSSISHLDVIEEKYIRLSGGVVLTLEDRESSAVHEIKADNIVFNQDTKSLTARGNIEYILTRNGQSEVFRGDSLSFDTESWEGVFFKGISERERDVQGETITFYYSGDSIYRSEDNVVTPGRRPYHIQRTAASELQYQCLQDLGPRSGRMGYIQRRSVHRSCARVLYSRFFQTG